MDLTLGVGIYASIVATIVAAWTVFGIWRDRSAVKIQIRYGYIEQVGERPYLRSSTAFLSEKVDANTLVLIEATNIGRRSVVLRSGGLLFKDSSSRLWFSGDGLAKQYPMRLAEGENGSTSTRLSSLQSRFKSEGWKSPMWGYFTSEAGKTYKVKVSRRMVKVFLETK